MVIKMVSTSYLLLLMAGFLIIIQPSYTTKCLYFDPVQDRECKDHKNANCTKIVTCGETGGYKEYCYALWKKESGKIEFLKCGGCFADKPCAEYTDCVGEPHSSGVFYCCCSGDLCNRNMSSVTVKRTRPSADVSSRRPTPTIRPTSPTQRPSEISRATIITVSVITVNIIIVIVLSTVILLVRRRRRNNETRETAATRSSNGPSSPTMDSASRFSTPSPTRSESLRRFSARNKNGESIFSFCTIL